jgi:hypothetical protein
VSSLAVASRGHRGLPGRAPLRCNSGHTWIRQKHVTQFLQELAVTPTVTHQGLDALPSSRTREYIRGLLIEHGALPQRDLYRARYGEWARDALDRLMDPVNRDVTLVDATLGCRRLLLA